MTKSEKRRKNNSETSASPTHQVALGTRVDKAFAAFEDGDVVAARRWAQQALANLEAPEEQQAAHKLAKKLWAKDDQTLERTPREVLLELHRRTQVPGSSYGFALLALAIILVMLLLAHFRGA